MRLHVSDIICQLCLWKCHKALAKSKRRKEGRETREEPQWEQLNFLKHLLKASHEAKCFHEGSPLILTTATRYRFFTDWFFRWRNWGRERLRRWPHRLKQNCLFSKLYTRPCQRSPWPAGHQATCSRVQSPGSEDPPLGMLQNSWRKLWFIKSYGPLFNSSASEIRLDGGVRAPCPHHISPSQFMCYV